MDVVRAAMQEVIDEANRHVKEEQERMEALEKNAARTITKKDKKAILFELHGVKRLNAETILDRPGEMRLLRDVTSRSSDPKSFRVPEATKGAGYSCPWGAREDGMLCVGIARHGYGAWEKIRDDPDLELHDKFFLEEHRVDKKAEREKSEGKNAKSPGAVHLVRRADYLLSVLKSKFVDDPAAKRAVENHHRNNKKNGMHTDLKSHNSASISASPAPSAHRKAAREPERHRQRTLSHGHRDSVERLHTRMGVVTTTNETRNTDDLRNITIGTRAMSIPPTVLVMMVTRCCTCFSSLSGKASRSSNRPQSRTCQIRRHGQTS
jgi:chromodomain-helicase-DNA-binding protein 1